MKGGQPVERQEKGNNADFNLHRDLEDVVDPELALSSSSLKVCPLESRAGLDVRC